MMIVEESSGVNVRIDYELDENGRYITDEVGIVLFSRRQNRDRHQVNLVCAKWGGGEFVFSGPDSLRDFIRWSLSFNFGNNILIAHNSSGYDACLILNEVYSSDFDCTVTPIMKGQKILQLKLGGNPLGHSKSFPPTIFRDSLLHIPGSLASLAEEQCGHLLRKGHFPHGFNTPENQDYVGPLPAVEYFDGLFGSRTRLERLKLREWWNLENEKGDWDFKKELLAYCRNDVLVLYHLVSVADETFREMHPFYGASLFHSMTMPSYIAAVIQVSMTERWLDSVGLDRDHPQKDDRFVRLVQEATEKKWSVLLPYEHGMARACLRGGRTEVKMFVHEGKAKYVDVKSMYPFHQVVQRFPTGIPTVWIWDLRYRPCRHPDCDNSFRLKCSHEEEKNKASVRWKKMGRQPTALEIIEGEDWHGFGVVSLTPPNDLIHPVLPVFDEELGKCVFTLEKMEEQPVVGVELKRALQLGYRLDMVHRWDSYRMEDSPWAEDCIPMYLQKEFNSREQPEDLDSLAEDYERIHDDLSDGIRYSDGMWGKNPAKKKAAKVALNCIWGKQAERVEKETTQIFSLEDEEEIEVFYANLEEGNYSFKGIMALGNDRVCFILPRWRPNISRTARESNLKSTNSTLPLLFM
jgi:hypothetical protein